MCFEAWREEASLQAQTTPRRALLLVRRWVRLAAVEGGVRALAAWHRRFVVRRFTLLNIYPACWYPLRQYTLEI